MKNTDSLPNDGNFNLEKRKVTSRQARHLSRLSGEDVRKLEGKPVTEVNELLKWRIDPALLFYRRICGKVVRKNPATGDLEPVPNATVHVEDTDCSFLGLFPFENPYFWLFPFNCSREVLATVVTDACGNFCVNIPLWDIDRYVRFRRERICFGEIFKPSIRDILEDIRWRDPIPFPRPMPAPPPFRFDHERIELLEQVLGPDVAERVERVAEIGELGGRTRDLDRLLDGPAFVHPAPPPLALETKAEKKGEIRLIAPTDAIPVEDDVVRRIDFGHYIGPFLRCVDVLVPEWTTVYDVPDLTFRVTQDVDGDGTEETIYSEGYFDVRWNAPTPLSVTLVASASALSVPHCEPVEGVDCEDEPAIVTAGYMPIEATHHDAVLGTATRVNRPKPPDGRYTTPQSGIADAPYARRLNLHGCHRFDPATHYRLTYAFQPEGTTSFSSPVPFTGLEWWAPRLGPGAPIHVVPDADGWYPILSAADVAHPNWLLSWPTHAYGNGLYEIRLELGQASAPTINVINTSGPRRFRVDNTNPDVSFLEIRWRPATTPLSDPWTAGNSTLLPTVCPILHRPAGATIHMRVVWTASARRLRNAHLSGAGCGGGGFTFVTPVDTHQHWHVSAADNAVAETAVLELPGNRPAGCYHVRADAWGRAFNPSGFDAGPSANWYINQGAFSWSHVSRSISVVDA